MSTDKPRVNRCEHLAKQKDVVQSITHALQCRCSACDAYLRRISVSAQKHFADVDGFHILVCVGLLYIGTAAIECEEASIKLESN